MSIEKTTIGLFGKLPAHGDFVQRNLSAEFINIWDDWLQHFIAGTKEQMGDNWLDIYLTSPLWRFAFSSGVIDENNWAGIMIPSVDRVGRYYPFSIVMKLTHIVNPFEFLQYQKTGYENIEKLALDALDGQITIDELVDELDNINIDVNTDYSRSDFNMESDSYQFDIPCEDDSVVSVYPLLLDGIMTKTFQSYSIWQTAGSELVSPSLFSCQGLPGVQKMPAMMNGDWQSHQWQQPYNINQISLNNQNDDYRDEL